MIWRSRRLSVVCSFWVIGRILGSGIRDPGLGLGTRGSGSASPSRPRSPDPRSLNVIFITSCEKNNTSRRRRQAPLVRRAGSARQIRGGEGIVDGGVEELFPRAREPRRPGRGAAPHGDGPRHRRRPQLFAAPRAADPDRHRHHARLPAEPDCRARGPLRQRSVDHAAVVRAHDRGRGGTARHDVDRGPERTAQT